MLKHKEGHGMSGTLQECISMSKYLASSKALTACVVMPSASLALPRRGLMLTWLCKMRTTSCGCEFVLFLAFDFFGSLSPLCFNKY
jgi:hypothetical protein